MKVDPDLVAPCGLYCGVCAVYIGHRDNNQKLKLPAASCGESSTVRNSAIFRFAR
jgi:hypothetical protein